MLIVCVKVSQVNKIDHADSPPPLFFFFFSEEKKRKRCPFPGLHKASFLISSPNVFSGSSLARGHVTRWEPRQGKHRVDTATGSRAWLTTPQTSAAMAKVFCPLMMTSLSFPQGIQQYKKKVIMQAWHSCLGGSHYIKCCLLLQAPIRVPGKQWCHNNEGF